MPTAHRANNSHAHGPSRCARTCMWRTCGGALWCRASRRTPASGSMPPHAAQIRRPPQTRPSPAATRASSRAAKPSTLRRRPASAPTCMRTRMSIHRSAPRVYAHAHTHVYTHSVDRLRSSGAIAYIYSSGAIAYIYSSGAIAYIHGSSTQHHQRR